MHFSIIAACDENRGIGKNNKLPWRLPADLKYFSEVTGARPDNWVIMGRKTWESLPSKHRPLAGRKNLVLTTSSDYEVPAGVVKADSLETALEIIQKDHFNEIFVVGGANVFAQAVGHPACTRILLTEIKGVHDCDTFFPMFDKAKYTRTEDTRGAMEENGIRFTFTTYIKISNFERK